MIERPKYTASFTRIKSGFCITSIFVLGLDPAGPLFNFNRPGDRLSRHSALFVDVVHTCGMYLGTVHAIGHVDFYPNRGTPVQPGCGIDLLGKIQYFINYYKYISLV